MLFAVMLFLVPVNSFATEGSDQEFSSGVDSPRTFVKACRHWIKTLRRLDLSEEQAADVADLLDAYRTEISQYGDEIIASKKELFIVVHKPVDDFDEQNVRDAFNSLQSLREEVVVDHAILMTDFQSVLTEEQYRKLVKSKLHLYKCAQAPSRIARRLIGHWVNKNQS